jgi:hypothetical protein
MSARASVAPVAMHFHSYISSFLLISLVSCFSLAVGAVYVALSNSKGAFTYTPVSGPAASPDDDLESFRLDEEEPGAGPGEARGESEPLLAGDAEGLNATQQYVQRARAERARAKRARRRRGCCCPSLMGE